MDSEDLKYKLQNWLQEEVPALSESGGGRSLLTSSNSLDKLLSVPENRNIFAFIAKHVRSRSTVAKIKGQLRRAEQLQNPENRYLLSGELASDDISVEEHLMRRWRSLHATRALLEKEVSDLENELIDIDKTHERLKRDLENGRRSCAVFEEAKHLFQSKVSAYKHTARRLQSGLCISKIKAHSTDTEASQAVRMQDNSFFLSQHILRVPNELKQLAIANLFSPLSYSAVHEVLLRIESVIKLASEHGNFKKQKEELVSGIGGVVSTFTARDIAFCLEQDAELAANSLSSVPLEKKDVDLHCIKKEPLTLSHIVSSPAKLELHRLSILHVKLFMDTQKLLKRLESLEKESNIALSNLVHKTGMEEDTLKQVMFEYSSTYVNSKLKEHLSHMKEKLLDMAFKISSQDTNSDEVVALQNDISSKKDALRDHLVKNNYIIHSFLPKWDYYASFPSLLESEKADLERAKPQLVYDFPQLERFFSSSVPSSDHCLEIPSLHFQDESVLLENCLSFWPGDIRHMVASRQRQMQKMNEALVTSNSLLFSDKDVAEECSILNELSESLENARKVLTQGESLLVELQQDLQNFKEQPAQFIPRVMLEKFSLEEWKSFFLHCEQNFINAGINK